MNCHHDDCSREVARDEDGDLVITDNADNGYCSHGCQQDQLAREHEAANRSDPLARAAEYKGGRY